MRSSQLPRKGVVYIDFVGSGGMHHYAESLASAICMHTSACVWRPSEISESNRSGLFPNLKVRLGALRKKYNPFYYFQIADEVIREMRPHVVHVCSRSIGLLPFTSRLRRSGIRTVVTVHDPMPHDETLTSWGRAMTSIEYAVLTPCALALCDAVYVHSEAHAELLLRRYRHLQRKKIYVVQHGVGATPEVLRGKLVPPELSQLTPGTKVVLFFGRIEPYKGLALLFSAFGRVAQEFLNAVLVVAGAGSVPEIDEISQGRVILVNRFIRDSEISALFSLATCVVLPYTTATQTGVVPLAAAFGVPAVVTNVGAISEFVSDRITGRIVPPGDPASLAEAILDVCVHGATAAEMGRRSREILMERYSWSAVSRLHLQVYRSLGLIPECL